MSHQEGSVASRTIDAFERELMYSRTNEFVAYGGLAIALVLGLSGCVISFAPFAIVLWYVMATIFAALGLLSFRERMQRIAVILVILFACIAVYTNMVEQQRVP
jgi:fucose 4-O-acetylase-like acetyltransferase